MEPPNIIPPDEEARLAAVHRYDILDTPFETAFDRITLLAARLFNTPIAIVSIVDNDRVWFKSHHGLDLPEVERLPGLCASAILQNDPLILTDASLDPVALSHPIVAGESGLRFYAGAPLTTADGHNVGTICVMDKDPREFSDEDAVTLQQLAEVVIHELELRIATRAAVDQERESRALESARRALEAAEHERTRWARELHDETLQNLGALQMLLVSGLTDREKLEATVNEAADLVQDEVVKLRHLISELRPAVLDQAGLEAALESLSRKLSVIDGLEVELNLEVCELGHRLNSQDESMLYRAVQEALANVAKHSEARRVEVTVRARARAIEAIIRDDGIGFEADTTGGGFGLLGMRERALLVGGELDVRTAPGAGTSVRFLMPLRDEPYTDGA
jgi:signal transduction histidine kinase